MGKFLDLMVATEADWDAETGAANVPEGRFIFQLKSSKIREDKDDCQLYFTVMKPVGPGPADFRSDKYRPVSVMFTERNLWLFKQFLKASGVPLNNVKAQLPKLTMKLYTGDVKHNVGSEPNPDGTPKIFVNLNNLQPYNPNLIPTAAPQTEDEDAETEGSLD